MDGLQWLGLVGNKSAPTFTLFLTSELDLVAIKSLCIGEWHPVLFHAYRLYEYYKHVILQHLVISHQHVISHQDAHSYHILPHHISTGQYGCVSEQGNRVALGLWDEDTTGLPGGLEGSGQSFAHSSAIASVLIRSSDRRIIRPTCCHVRHR